MRLYRSMREADDGLPEVGRRARLLGVRLGDSVVADVPVVSSEDMLYPDHGGMSVAPGDPQHLPHHRRPESLGGIGRDPVWYIEEDELGMSLKFRAESPAHGFVEPIRPMKLSDYEAALATTRRSWKRH